MGERGDQHGVGGMSFDEKNAMIATQARDELLRALPNPVPAEVAMDDDGKALRVVERGGGRKGSVVFKAVLKFTVRSMSMPKKGLLVGSGCMCVVC